MSTKQTQLFPPPARGATLSEPELKYLFSLQNLLPLRLGDTTSGPYAEALPPAGLNNSATGQSNQNQEIVYIKSSADGNAWTITGAQNGAAVLGAKYDVARFKSDGTNWWLSASGPAGGGAVTSVFGRVGAVVAMAGDYTVAQVTGAVPNTRTISTTAPLTGGGDFSADRTLAISDFTGDAGLGGTNGAVPAPAAGDAAAHKFLKATGRWVQAAYSDLSGTPQLPQTIAAAATKFLTAYDAVTGLFANGQPAFTDLSGTASVAQIPNLPASIITSGVLALARGGNTFALLGDLIYGGAAAAPTVLSGNITAVKQYLSQTGTGAVSAAPAWATIAATDVTGLAAIATSGKWSDLQNATAALTLANAGNATTFNQTSAVSWTWANTTAATNVLSQSSPIWKLAGRYWTGAADAEDSWTIQDVIANGSNGTSLLTFTHAGSTGVAALSIPAGTLGTAGAWGLTFAGTTVGLNASGTTVSLVTSSAFPSLRFYNGATLEAQITTATSSGVITLGMLSASGATSLVDIEGHITTTVTEPGVGLTNSASFTGTGAGTQFGVTVGNPSAGTVFNGTITFAPTSGATNFVAFGVLPVINQTSTASGNYTALRVNVVETSLKGAANLLLDLQAGAAGGTSMYAVNNSGVQTQYKQIATVGDGQPYEVATIDLTAQTAAKAATTVYTPTATGWYRLSMYLKVTTAATTGAATSTLAGATGVTITYTDGTDSIAQSVVMSLTKETGVVGINNAGNATTTVLYGSIAVYAKTGVAIQYAIDYTSNTANQMAYAARGRMEAM